MIGEKLKYLRLEKKLTQAELAKKLNLSRGTYAHYEIGKRNPDYETLQRLADFFNVSTDYLLSRIDQPFPNPELPVTGSKTKPLHKKIGALISAQVSSPAKNVSYKTLMKELNVSQEELVQLRSGEVAPTEKQAEILARLMNTKKEDYLPKEQVSTALPELNDKDERDIQKDLQKIINNLETGNGYSQFDGQTIEDMDEEDRELLIASLENSMRLAKRLAKQKFTPNKYRK